MNRMIAITQWLKRSWNTFLIVILRRYILPRQYALPSKESNNDDLTPPLLLAMDIIPPVEQHKVPLIRRAKWVKPKGLEKLHPKLLAESPRLRRDPLQVKKPKVVSHPELRPDDDPEQWGQYYFRDAILDQLDTYFVYLKRMRHGDKDSYELHRRLGIQIMPQSAIQSFDNWRSEEGNKELSAWWKENLPGFGAVSYGIDSGSKNDEKASFVDAPPEFFKGRKKPKQLVFNRIITVTGSSQTIDVNGEQTKVGIIWVPKFLYFTKYSKAPPDVQSVKDADIYLMTIYWDRVDGYSKRFHKKNKGGVPQEYAVCVDRENGNVRVLRRLIFEKIKIRGRHGTVYIPNKRWTVAPDSHLSWAYGRLDSSPEEYLRRCFIEAALMYESAALGSMIRIEARKGNLVAAFGVEIKRTAYFFKDRDITLTNSGRRVPIFHIVRPHTRVTKNGLIDVKLHFRGLREFEWAGYKIGITVPGRDHFSLLDFDIGSSQEKNIENRMGTTELGERLANVMKKGLGAWQNRNVTAQ